MSALSRAEGEGDRVFVMRSCRRRAVELARMDCGVDGEGMMSKGDGGDVEEDGHLFSVKNRELGLEIAGDQVTVDLGSGFG